jgi:hypothetical protein
MSAAKVFSLAEANELVPLVADLTSSVVRELDGIRQRYKNQSASSESEVPSWVLKEVEAALSEWSEKVVDLGAVPKGYFTVDFPSVDPELLYCWTYGEEKISHTHKVWENFSHRRKIESAVEPPTDHLKWVN